MYFWREVNFIFKYLIKSQPVRYCSKHLRWNIFAIFELPHLPLLTCCPRLTDIMMSLKDLSDGKKGQVVEAIMVKEVKPAVIIISNDKDSGALLMTEDPDRGAGTESNQTWSFAWNQQPWTIVVLGQYLMKSVTMRYFGSGGIYHEICNQEIFWCWCNISRNLQLSDIVVLV